MITDSVSDPVAAAAAGLAVGFLLGAGGAIVMPHVIAAACRMGNALARWRSLLNHDVRAAEAAPALSAELVAAIVAAVRTELDKAQRIADEPRGAMVTSGAADPVLPQAVVAPGGGLSTKSSVMSI